MWKDKGLTTNTKMGGIFLLFIVIIVGSVLVSHIATDVKYATETLNFDNESVDVTDARSEIYDILNNFTTGWYDNFTFTFNSSGGRVAGVSQVRHVNGTVLILNTDYITNVSYATLSMLNSSTNLAYTENITLVDYSFYEAGYVESTVGRTLLRVFIVLFFVIGIAAFVMGYVYNRFVKDIGF